MGRNQQPTMAMQLPSCWLRVNCDWANGRKRRVLPIFLSHACLFILGFITWVLEMLELMFPTLSTLSMHLYYASVSATV